MSMTKMERRSQRRLYVIACVSIVIAIISLAIAITTYVSFALNNSKGVDTQSRLILKEDGKEAQSVEETINVENEEPVEDPYETEHINEALFATGYLREDVPMSIDDQLALRAESDWYNIPYSICLSIIEGESNFDVENDDGVCYGLCGLNRNYFPDNLSSQENIHYGIECFAGKLEEYNWNVEAALTAYWNGHDDGRRGYANYILSFAEKWKALGVDIYDEVGK